MEVRVQAIAVGYDVKDFEGAVLTVRKTALKGPGETLTPAFVADYQTRTGWRDKITSADRAAVIGAGLIDLLLKWPSDDRQIGVWIEGQRRSNSIAIDELAPYELGPILAGLPRLPNTVVTVRETTWQRVDEIAGRLFALPVGRLDPILGTLAQVSTAAAARRPADRLVPLWAALRHAAPTPRGDLAFATTHVQGRAFTQSERERTPSWTTLASARGSIQRDHWFHEKLRRALTGPARSVADRMKAATIVAYAFRSAVAHGHWWPMDERRHQALAAEQWLWTLVERAIDIRVFGHRRPTVVAQTASAVQF